MIIPLRRQHGGAAIQPFWTARPRRARRARPRCRPMETPARGDGRRDRDLGKAARRRGARSDRLSLYRYVDDPGPAGQGRILDIIQDATGITALATSRLVLDA